MGYEPEHPVRVRLIGGYADVSSELKVLVDEARYAREGKPLSDRDIAIFAASIGWGQERQSLSAIGRLYGITPSAAIAANNTVIGTLQRWLALNRVHLGKLMHAYRTKDRSPELLGDLDPVGIEKFFDYLNSTLLHHWPEVVDTESRYIVSDLELFRHQKSPAELRAEGFELFFDRDSGTDTDEIQTEEALHLWEPVLPDVLDPADGWVMAGKWFMAYPVHTSARGTIEPDDAMPTPGGVTYYANGDDGDAGYYPTALWAAKPVSLTAAAHATVSHRTTQQPGGAMSNPTPLTTLPDGSPNNTGLQIDSDTVQINVEIEDFGRGRKSDIYIIPASNGRRAVKQIPTEWDPPSTESTSRVIGTVWRNGEEQHGFDLPGETYDGLHGDGAWNDYLEHHANGDIDEADALADDHKPAPPSGL